ncbi:hypothetical protein CMV_028349 [Castanea mollissima]|uniref:Uncharacterized protein n=1 Tax=Castanea mollissima TaxID=60419 RepID=A0A8J4Q913_9ROSI|nr:hypothetical protein CMV_028349 [Castanea mollissima]
MEGNNTYGASWADQWDYSNPDPIPNAADTKKNGGTSAKYKQKVGEGLGKTKAVASTGMKKVERQRICAWKMQLFSFDKKVVS